jgi:hypothetical protein
MRAYFLRFFSAFPHWHWQAPVTNREYVASMTPSQRRRLNVNPLVRAHRSRRPHRKDVLALPRLSHCQAMQKLRFVCGRLTTKVRGVEP